MIDFVLVRYLPREFVNIPVYCRRCKVDLRDTGLTFHYLFFFAKASYYMLQSNM